MIEQSYVLDVVPGGVPVVVHCHQNDVMARVFELRLVSRNGVPVIPAGASAFIEGQKVDGKVFSYEEELTSIAGETSVIVSLREQMTVLAGDVKCQCKITSGGQVLICANFILRVEEDYTVGADTSETEIPGMVQQAQAAAEAAEHATTDLQMELDALSARMDEFTNLPVGSTAGDAELADIRVAYNGETYGNAGTAVREQVKQVVGTRLNLFKKEFAFDVQANGLPSTKPRALSSPMLIDGEATVYAEYMGVGIQLSIALYSGEDASTFINYSDLDWHDAGTLLYKGDAKYIRLYFWKQNDLPLSDNDFVSAKITVINGYETPVYYEVNTAEDKIARAKLDHALDNCYLNVCTWNVGLWGDGDRKTVTLENIYKWYRAIGACDSDMLFTQESLPEIVPGQLDYSTFMGNKYDYIEAYVPTVASPWAGKGIASKEALYDVTIHNLNEYRTYIKGYIIYNKKRICLINCHLDWRPAGRRQELDMILAAMQKEEYVICCGDFNIESVSEWDIFRNAGYKLANDGAFGQFHTWPHGSSSWPNEITDNVIVSSNINIQNVQMLSGTGDFEVSDHAALMVALRIT